MKKRNVVLLLAALLAAGVEAQEISVREASSLAAEFFAARYGNSGLYAGNGKSTEPAYVGRSETNPEKADLYVFNNSDRGFVIISGDTRTDGIVLGYSDEGAFNPDNIPVNLKDWLDAYCTEIDYLNTMSGNVISAGAMYLPKSAEAIVGPLLGDIEWGQGRPYNELAPTAGSSRCPTGCVATAMAQIMCYHQWPLQGKGSHSYQWNNQTLSSDFSLSVYNWDIIEHKYSYYGGSEDSRANVARLMYDCGVSIDMEYGPSGSGAFTFDVPSALANYFSYSSTVAYRQKNRYTKTEWEEMMKAELNAGRPILHSGVDSSAGGHAFVCDGYDSDDYFHFNWGWDGDGNGYFKSSALNVRGYRFNTSREIVIGIEPDTDVWDDWSGTGTGTYTFANIVQGTQENVHFRYRNSIDGRYTEYETSDWGAGIMSDSGVTAGFVVDRATGKVAVHIFNTGAQYEDYDLFACDVDNSFGPLEPATYPSEYNPETNTVELNLFYYLMMGGGQYSYFYPKKEILTLPEVAPSDVIEFADSVAWMICLDNWDFNGDGLFCESEAARVDSLGRAFADCETLSSLDELAFFTSLGEIGTGSFRNCTSLRSLTVPGAVTIVADSAFWNCTSLNGMSIPKTISSIGHAAFGGCLFDTVRVENMTPAALFADSFDTLCYRNSVLDVPAGSEERYRSAEGWRLFNNVNGHICGYDSFDNAIYVNDTTFVKNHNVTFAVRMKNTTAVSGFQFDLKLPEGLSIAEGTGGAFLMEPVESVRKSGFSVLTNVLDDGAVRILCCQQGTNLIEGNGVVMLITLGVDRDASPGAYDVEFRNIVLSDSAANAVEVTALKSVLYMEDYVEGDSNCDGKVNVGDATALISFLLETAEPSYCFYAADIDGNGTVRVDDLALLVRKILEAK